MINKILFICISLAIGGCEVAPKKRNAEEVLDLQTRQRIFYAPFDQVWRALHLMIKYPLVNDNSETGIIETDWVKAIDGYQPPFVKKPDVVGVRYRLRVSVSKGQIEGKAATRVTVEKEVQRQRDFFSEPEALLSDGLEEKLLLYRVERELQIQAAIKEFQKP